MSIDIRFSILVYFSVLVVSFSAAYFAQYTKRWENEIFCRFILFFAMLIPAMLRYNLGADYDVYEKMYIDGSYKTYAEPGYNLICDFFKFFGFSSWWMFFSVACITYFVLAFKVKKKQLVPFILFYILYTGYFRSLDQIRQSLALPFIILCFYAFCDKKYIKSAFLVFIATMFHSSSILFAVFIPLSCLHISKKNTVLLVVLGVVMIQMINFGDVINQLVWLLFPKYGRLTNFSSSNMGSGLGLTINLFFPLCFIIFSEHPKKCNYMNPSRVMAVSRNFCLFYIALYFLTFQITIFNRVRDVIWAGVLFAVPHFYSRKYQKVIMLIVLLFGIALFYRNALLQVGPGTTEISPYRTIFEK